MVTVPPPPLELHHGSLLDALGQTISGDIAAALSGDLRCDVRAWLCRVTDADDQPPPMYRVVLEAESRFAVAIEFSAGVIQPIVARLLGAADCVTPPPQRPLTNIERRLLDRPMAAVATRMSQTLSGLRRIDLRVGQRPVERSIAFELDASITSRSGGIVVRLAESLANSLTAAAIEKALAGETEQLPPSFQQARIPLGAIFANHAEYFSLQPGDVVKTGVRANDPITLQIAGRALRARAVQYRGRRAVRVLDVLPMPEPR